MTKTDQNPPSTNDGLSDEQIARYRADGFLVLPGLFAASELTPLREAFARIEARAAKLQDDHYDGVTFFKLHRDANPFAKDVDEHDPVAGTLRRVTYPYAIDETIDDLRRSPKLLAVMQSLLGDNLVQLVNQMNFNAPGMGTGWGWHQDYRFRRPELKDPLINYVQCLIAVDPCNETTGGLRLIPRSYELGALSLDLDADAADRQFQDAETTTPVLAPGDGVIFNPFVVHGSTPNRSPSRRRVFINGYANAGACGYGNPVLRGGQPCREEDAMEYENDPDVLAKASKY